MGEGELRTSQSPGTASLCTLQPRQGWSAMIFLGITMQGRSCRARQQPEHLHLLFWAVSSLKSLSLPIASCPFCCQSFVSRCWALLVLHHQSCMSKSHRWAVHHDSPTCQPMRPLWRPSCHTEVTVLLSRAWGCSEPRRWPWRIELGHGPAKVCSILAVLPVNPALRSPTSLGKWKIQTAWPSQDPDSSHSPRLAGGFNPPLIGHGGRTVHAPEWWCCSYQTSSVPPAGLSPLALLNTAWDRQRHKKCVVARKTH